MDFNHLEIDAIRPANLQACPNGGVVIEWSANNIGFGQMDMWWEKDGRIHVDTESMSNNANREFVKKIFDMLAERVVVDA